MKIYFIGGASGSGKTAIMENLQIRVGPQISVYDFDDIGVPEDADARWRQSATEQWLKKLISENKNACLLGQIVLGEILSCPSAQAIEKISYCLLDVSDYERIQRLRKRNTYGVDQHMLNWSSWLRMHLFDPQWAQNVIKDNAWEDLDFTKVEALNAWEPLAHTKILDTTGLDINQVANEVSLWVQS
ncbi:MAG: hypothetical protein CMF48_07690 [Legionellales bacterium]|nr:hypothetical protein [Legionellales bacterium]